MAGRELTAEKASGMVTTKLTRSRLTRCFEAGDIEDDVDLTPHTDQVVLAGSMGALSTMAELAAQLERFGLRAVVPTPDDDPTAWTIEAMDDFKRRASFEHMAHIRDRRTVALLVANIDREGSPNYIGPNTFAEIAIAFADSRPVYLLQSIPSQYEDELRAWGVNCLYGDVSRLVDDVAEVDGPSLSAGDNAQDAVPQKAVVQAH